MSDENFVWIPSEKEREEMIKVSDKVIDILSPYPEKVQAFILQSLLISFKEVSGIDVISLIENES